MNKKEIKEKITQFFANSENPVQIHDIALALKIKSNSEDYDNLKRVLDDLTESKFLKKAPRRKFILNKQDTSDGIKGTVSIKNDRGVVYTNDPEFPKINIKLKHLQTALDGDDVTVKLFALKKSKKARGEVIKILHRSKETIVGMIEFDGSFYFIIPDDEKYYVDFLVHSSNLKGASPGDKVAANFLLWDDPNKSPEAEVIEIIGKAGKPQVEYDSIIKEFGLPKKFTPVTIDLARSLAKPVDKLEFPERFDLTTDEIITIDPPDAKDYDDALSLKILENGNYLLGVHIADVSYYVRNNSVLDEEAQTRGNSIYLVDRVIPMLPEELSNGICSLAPETDRLTFSVIMEITERGALKDYKISESIINSKKRFDYDEAQRIIDTGEGEHSELLLKLNKLANILRKKRFAKAGVDFETLEVKFILDEYKYPVKAILKERSDSTSLVEECMLMANKTVAEHISKLSKSIKLRRILPFLYRIHDEPNPGKVTDVINLSRTLGYKLDSYKITSKELNKLIEAARNKPEKFILHQLLLRAMAKAEYSPDNIGHWGLGFKEYTHFTSPIRRYPDLIVHRLLKEYMKGNIDKRLFEQLDSNLDIIGEHCTGTERLAMDAERASVKLTNAVLASSFIGKEFSGTISGVASFGIFILLDDIYSEGFINMRDLHDDYYIYDDKNYRLTGRHHGKVFQIGKRIYVQIIHVNIEKRKIDLKYVDDIR
jgi:ribonuclease R